MKEKAAAAGDKYRQPGPGTGSRLCLLLSQDLHLPERLPLAGTMSLRVLLLLAAALCLCRAQGSENQASDCCLTHKNHPIPHQLVASYRLQGPETGCRLAAAVFITKRSRSLCAPPKARWALQLMEKLERPKAQRSRGPTGSLTRRKGAKARKNRKPQQ
ncbi:C-C motif chemokine 19-like [Carettochelys insculpta]|uniref:C-C motif chemokine 19-like n=1 Tax=Carettochelys insculpta TaxID=44489 RepID=UPI003EC0D545